MLLSKYQKIIGKTRFRRKRIRFNFEEKAKAVAYYDSLPLKNHGIPVPKDARFQVACTKGPTLVDSANILSTWLTSRVRKNIERAVARPIEDYAPGKDKVKNMGGRGKKAASRQHLVMPAVLTGRRPVKSVDAEAATLAWMRVKRTKGIKLTSRIIKSAMKIKVRLSANSDVAKVFKASTGWMKRFMLSVRVRVPRPPGSSRPSSVVAAL